MGSRPLPTFFTDKILPMWQAHHADGGCKIELWTEEKITDLPLTNKEIICDKELNPGMRADFLRVELLYMFGGIYADVDMTCEKSLTPLLQ